MGEVGEPGLNGTDGRIGIPGMQVRIFLINLHCSNWIFFSCSFYAYRFISRCFFLLFISTCFFSTVHVNYSCLPVHFSVFHCNGVMLLSNNAGSPWSRRSDGSER